MKKFPLLYAGFTLLGTILVSFVILAIFDYVLASRFLSMITANHIGGRLAFITVGLENGFSPQHIIPIIIFYNTTYLLLMYSLFVIFSKEIKRLRIIDVSVEALKRKAQKRKRSLKKWNRFFIFIFVWIPLPWTGAVIGSYIAHLEGYSIRDTLLTVIPAMWIGVISWTLWFDELYEFIEQFGKGNTMLVTICLLMIPVIVYLFNIVVKKNKNYAIE